MGAGAARLEACALLLNRGAAVAGSPFAAAAGDLGAIRAGDLGAIAEAAGDLGAIRLQASDQDGSALWLSDCIVRGERTLGRSVPARSAASPSPLRRGEGRGVSN
jgi:hypothetical protein